MEYQSRPAEMSDLEWLTALEDIRQLKARRDRYVDAHDWDAYEALHAPDHVSIHASSAFEDSPVAWTTAAEMVENVKKQMTEVDTMTVHHSYDPEIILDTPTKARAIWAMTAAQVFHEADGSDGWQIVHGYYHESCEKRDGRWVFTLRSWHRYFANGSRGIQFPGFPPTGSAGFTKIAGAKAS